MRIFQLLFGNYSALDKEVSIHTEIAKGLRKTAKKLGECRKIKRSEGQFWDHDILRTFGAMKTEELDAIRDKMKIVDHTNREPANLKMDNKAEDGLAAIRLLQEIEAMNR